MTENWQHSIDKRTLRGGICCLTRKLLLGVLSLSALFSALNSPLVISAPHEPFNSSKSLDKQVAITLETLTSGDIAQARILARQMAHSFPNFALGQLLSAELESAAAFKDVIAGGGSNPMSTQLMQLLLEAQARLAGAATSKTTDAEKNQQWQLPDGVIQMGSAISQLLLVDLANSTLVHVIGDDRSPNIVRQHYIGSGKAGYGKRYEGDNKTPLGIYNISGLRSDASLPDLYGSGALVLDYPNALDRYLGRTGSGIWLHGVPHAQRSRAPRSSEGCVTMSNDHFLILRNQVAPSNTLVFLGHDFQWSNADQRHQQQLEFQALFRRYQQAWSSSNKAALAALYEHPDTLLQRPAYRELFQLKVKNTSQLNSGTSRYQDTLSAHTFSAGLSEVNAEDVAIFTNPSAGSQNTANASQYVVMRARFGSMNEQQITIYWSRGADKTWRVVSEQLDNLDI